MFSGQVLMEFPSIVVDGSVYFVRNNGGTYRLDADTGKVKWKDQLGSLTASTPAYCRRAAVRHLAVGQDRRPAGPQRQDPVAEAARPRTESSPIVRRGVVYFGTEGGALYALLRADRAREVEVPGERRDQGLARAVGQHAVRRRLHRAHVRRLGAHRAASAGRPAPRGRSSASAGGTSTPPRRSPSAACTPATPTARSIRSAPAPARSPGASAPAATSTRRRPWPTSDGRPTVYVGLLRRQPVRARRAHRRRCAGRTRRRAHLRRPDGDREHRLLRGPRLEVDLRRRRAHRRSASSAAAAASTTRGLGRPAAVPDRLRSVTALDPVRKPRRESPLGAREGVEEPG